MTLNRFIFKTHKWLATGVGLFTALWFLSGIVMVMPQTQGPTQSQLSGGFYGPQGDSAPFRQTAVSVPQAIAAADKAAGHALTIQNVSLRAVAGKLEYAIETSSAGTFLIDAMDGTRLVVDEDLVRKIGASVIRRHLELTSVSLLLEHTNEYKNGPLPIYRLAANDARESLLFIKPDTGELVTTSTRLGRLRMLVVQLHTFGYLRPELDPQTVGKLLVMFGAAGLLMSLFGGGILILQFRNWFVARRRMA